MAVLVLGAASWNRMVHLERLPQGRSATIFAARETEGAGSTGVGKAMALAALGHAPQLHCALGRDGPARQVRVACAARGIGLIVDEQAEPTPRHLNIMDRAGGRYSIFLSNGTDEPALDRDRLSAAIAAAPTVFLSLCNSSRVALPLLDGYAGEVLLDLHDWDGQTDWHRPFIGRADVVQISDAALAEPAPVIAALLAGRARQVVLTRGADGAVIATRGGRVEVPPCKAVLRDANGAGDAFSVALWDAQKRGLPPAQAGRFAAAAAALALESDALYPEDGGTAAVEARIRTGYRD